MKRDLPADLLAREVTITLPLGRLVQAFASDTPSTPTAVQRLERAAVPAIGAEYEGGIYAGVTLHEGLPHALVLLEPTGENLTWEKAKAFAAEHGGELPTRIDMIVLWKNVRDRFRTDDWYWTCEQPESTAEYAWVQDFDGGYQDYLDKGYEGLARAVRRVPI